MSSTDSTEDGKGTGMNFNLHPVDDIDSLVTVADWREDVNWYNQQAEAEGPEGDGAEPFDVNELIEAVKAEPEFYPDAPNRPYLREA